MNTGYKDFCKVYKKKLELDKDIKENPTDIFDNDYRDRITFHLTEYITNQMCSYIGIYTGSCLFTLDEEDMEYLYNKYSKKVKAEMEQNIKKVRNDYNNIIPKP